MSNKKDTSYFIERSIKIHGNKYDYSKVNYINNTTPVLIGYLGIFYEVTPQNHYKGSKIEKIRRKWTHDTFVEFSSNLHKNRYTYEKMTFEALGKKYIITCKKHGDFFQKGNEHVAGHGCPKCGKESASLKIKTKSKEIIERIFKKWGNYYKYHNLDENIEMKTILVIECPKHGIYRKRVSDHLQYSCIKCCKLPTSEGRKLAFSAFLDKAIKKWNNFYDYSKFTYKNSQHKSTIICPLHGEFQQSPNIHLRSGCKACGYERLSQKKRYKIDQFIDKSNRIHNGKYSYEKVDYCNSRTKICIVCPHHGDFYQTAGSHLCGVGCPVCRESKGEKIIRHFLEKNNIFFEREKKFDDCQNKTHLPFDFYIESKNLIIEFDGAQHYKPMLFFGGKQGFESIKINDKRKTEFCQEAGIKLLRISYKEIKKIESILEKNLL